MSRWREGQGDLVAIFTRLVMVLNDIWLEKGIRAVRKDTKQPVHLGKVLDAAQQAVQKSKRRSGRQ